MRDYCRLPGGILPYPEWTGPGAACGSLRFRVLRLEALRARSGHLSLDEPTERTVLLDKLVERSFLGNLPIL